MQRAAGPYHRKDQEYDKLLEQAVKLGRQHETKARDFVPRMYEILVKGEGLEPSDAADRIYKDLIGIWQKDTIRRLLPPESKNQVAREMQALRRFPLESKVGLILHESNEAGAALDDDSNTVAVLEKENARLRRTVEELESAKKSLLERTLRLERLLAEQQQQYNNRQRGIQEPTSTIMLPPHLFMKAYALMRGSTKPLVLRVTAKEAVDIDKMKI
jgi:hypothetical protein